MDKQYTLSSELVTRERPDEAGRFVQVDHVAVSEQGDEQVAELNTLFTVTRMVSQSLILEHVLSQALSSILMSLNFEAGLISLIDPVEGQLRLAVEQRLPSLLSRDGQRHKLVDLLGTYVHEHRQSLVLDGYKQEIPPAINEIVVELANAGLRACICIPLLHQEKSLGVLSLFAHQPRHFPKNEITLLNAIGHQVATGVANARLFQTTAKYEFIVNTSGEFMILVGKNYTYEVINEAYAQAHNKTQAEIVGKTIADIWGEDRFQTIIKPRMDDCFNGHEVRYQAWLELPTQGRRYLDVSYSPYYDKGRVTHVVAVARDITESKQIEEQLFHSASHDALTNLPNRTLFMDYLDQAIERGKWDRNYLFAVLFIDLDRFKNINDSLGHLVGDQLLIAIANRLINCTRPNDTIARMGGDEFSILLDDIRDIDEARGIADRIQKELAMPITLNGHPIFTTASIGITTNKRNYELPEDLLRDADTAMYQAKARGKARHELFETGQHTRTVARWQLEADLWRAIEQKELEVYYQPIVSLACGQVTGVEALLRWQHPQHGLLGPDKFISLTEETGLIIPISEWLLRVTSSQIKTWHEAGYGSLRVTVNVSRRQLQDQNLPRLIKTILEETDLAPEALELEITECTTVRENGFDTTVLTELRAMGLQISLDDFGLGSSLGGLKRLPLDRVKIDQHFVRDMAGDEEISAIIAAMISMAHSLNLKVIAEGVETEAQLNFLGTQQCDEGQGYLFSKPMPADALTNFLQKTHRFNLYTQYLQNNDGT